MVKYRTHYATFSVYVKRLEHLMNRKLTPKELKKEFGFYDKKLMGF